MTYLRNPKIFLSTSHSSCISFTHQISQFFYTMQAILSRTRKALEETVQEHETQRAGNFQYTKRNLPTIDCRIGIPILDRIFSYLGQRNPFAYDVDPAKEIVWLLDNTAYRPTSFFSSKCGPWQAEFRAAYFKKRTGSDVSKLVAAIADNLELGKGQDVDGDGDEDEVDKHLVAKTIAERLQPFVNTIAPARSVKVKLPTCGILRLGPGGPSAGSKQIVSRLGEHEDGEIAYIPAVPQEATPYGPMKTYFAGPEGWAIISGNALPSSHQKKKNIKGETNLQHHRHRRHNQNNNDPFPHRHPPLHIHHPPNPHSLHALSLHSHLPNPLTDLVLPLRLALQSLPLSLSIYIRALPPWPHLPPLSILDGSLGLTRVPNTGHKNL